MLAGVAVFPIVRSPMFADDDCMSSVTVTLPEASHDGAPVDNLAGVTTPLSIVHVLEADAEDLAGREPMEVEPVVEG